MNSTQLNVTASQRRCVLTDEKNLLTKVKSNHVIEWSPLVEYIGVPIR